METISLTRRHRFRFSLRTLFELTTGFSVCLFLLVVSPALGVAALIFAPILVRAIASIREFQRLGTHTTWREKLNHVLTSLVVMIVISLITFSVWLLSELLCIAFWIVVRLLQLNSSYFHPQSFFGQWMPAMVSLLAGGYLYWSLWPLSSDFNPPELLQSQEKR